MAEPPATPDLQDQQRRQRAADRLRAALADPLTDLTSDEVAPSGQAHQSKSDSDYVAERPPHHG